MANEQNLKRLSSKEARENGQKGGIASVQSRRRTKTMRSALERMLTAPVSAATDKKKLAAMGIPVEDMTQEELVALAIVRKAAAGDVQAYRAMWQVLGEDMPNRPGLDAESSGLLQAIAEAMGK